MLSNYLLNCSQFLLLGTLGTHWEVEKTQSEHHGNLVRTLWEHHNPKKSKPLGNQLWNWPWPESRTKGSYTDSTCQTQNYWSRKFDLAPYLATIIFYKYFRDPKSKGLPFLKNPRPKPDSSCKKPRTGQHWYSTFRIIGIPANDSELETIWFYFLESVFLKPHRRPYFGGMSSIST